MPDPDNREGEVLRRVRRLMQENRLREAVSVCGELNSMFPTSGDGWCASSVLACRLGNPEKGVEYVNRALALQPANPRFLIARANASIRCQDRRGALDDAERAASLAPSDSEVLDMAGGICSLCEDYEGAATFYEKAIALSPENHQSHFNLGTVKRFLGDSEGAEESLSHAITLNSSDSEAFLLRSDLRKQTPSNNHVAEISGHLERSLSWRDEMKLRFALAKELEDLGMYEESFTSLKQASDLRRRHMSYEVDHDLQTISDVIATYSSKTISEITPGLEEPSPIFIVGLPRTGTTLVERILASHDQVQSLGELNDFALELVQQVKPKLPANSSRSLLVEKSCEIDFFDLGSGYLERIRRRRDSSVRFIDKLPLNYLYCGLIHAALPNAKLVHVVRHPMDACYAMYKRLFRDAYPMSYDLSDLGRYYLAYRELMQHWYSVLPGVIHTVSYEALVGDLETVTRELLSYCELEFQEACLAFNENPAASTTASALQVRQPVYDSSVNRWRCYERQLGSLSQILEKSGINLDAREF